MYNCLHMDMMKTTIRVLTAILICGAMACSSHAEFIPNAPDYSDTAMWVTADGDSAGTGADIFYVVSTWEEDWVRSEGRYATTLTCGTLLTVTT